jgi:hypothetical protein
MSMYSRHTLNESGFSIKRKGINGRERDMRKVGSMSILFMMHWDTRVSI